MQPANSTDITSMRRYALGFSALLLVLAGRADEPAPAPRTLRTDEALPYVEEAPLPRPIDNSPLAEFRRELEALQSERKALDEDRRKLADLVLDHSEPSSNASDLRFRLHGLLFRMSQGGRSRPPAPTPPPPLPPPAPLPAIPEVPPPAPMQETGSLFLPVTDQAPEPVALAIALFRAGKYQPALQAFRMLPNESRVDGERTILRYLTACCLRNLGKGEEAAALYREVANDASDPDLSVLAQWQLQLQRSEKEWVDRLQQIRQRRLALEASK